MFTSQLDAQVCWNWGKGRKLVGFSCVEARYVALCLEKEAITSIKWWVTIFYYVWLFTGYMNIGFSFCFHLHDETVANLTSLYIALHFPGCMCLVYLHLDIKDSCWCIHYCILAILLLLFTICCISSICHRLCFVYMHVLFLTLRVRVLMVSALIFVYITTYTFRLQISHRCIFFIMPSTIYW